MSDFPLFSNIPRHGSSDDQCSIRTILVLSKTNSPERAEDDQVQGRSAGYSRSWTTERSDASDSELREVLQSVAQPGKPGQDVRCVVSVGMLTEGWDCQRVTHILGYRKFGSQLLCEQTMGRALRRRDYDNLEDVARRDSGEVEQRFPVEYAVVFGVPFVGREAATKPLVPPPPWTHVHPVPERVEEFQIWVPDFAGYTTSSPGLKLKLDPHAGPRGVSSGRPAREENHLGRDWRADWRVAHSEHRSDRATS